jgi:hypothetical protein
MEGMGSVASLEKLRIEKFRCQLIAGDDKCRDPPRQSVVLALAALPAKAGPGAVLRLVRPGGHARRVHFPDAGYVPPMGNFALAMAAGAGRAADPPEPLYSPRPLA